MGVEKQDKKIYSTPSSKQIEKARKLLLAERPRPFIYVYVVENGFDLHVANEWGTAPSVELVIELKQLLAENMGVVHDCPD